MHGQQHQHHRSATTDAQNNQKWLPNTAKVPEEFWDDLTHERADFKQCRRCIFNLSLGREDCGRVLIVADTGFG